MLLRESGIYCFLSKLEEKMLDGEYGEGYALAMSAIVKLGELYEAKKLIKISSVHIDASTYGGIYDAGLQLCEKLAEANVSFQVPATLCISAIDFEKWQKLGIPEDYANKQIKLAEAYKKLGAIPTWTCAPYQCIWNLRFGQDIAWGESNAVAFVNSVIGARTNRCADLIDVCAAITGRFPKFGLHLKENRKGDVLFKIKNLKAKTLSTADYAALGYYIGKSLKDEIPVISGVNKNVNNDQLKSFGAAAASSGAVALFHMIGITPEAKNLRSAFQGDKPKDKIEIGIEELRKTKDELSSSIQNPEAIILGCPHYSLDELQLIAKYLKDKKIKPQIRLLIFINKATKLLAEEQGYIEIIEKAGGEILTGTCLLHFHRNAVNFNTIMTDSAKMAHYAPNIHKLNVIFNDLKSCLKVAIGKNKN